MGAIVNGLNLHGLRAFGATFFNFLDYMKRRGAAGRADAPAGRSSSTRTTRSGWARTGPTHQPIEQLAILRAHAEHLRGAARRRQRDGALPGSFALDRTDGPDRAACSAARTCRSWTPTRSPPTRSSAAPMCCGRLRGRRARADPDRHRLRGQRLPRGRGAAGGRRDRHARGRPRPASTASPSRTPLTATACCRPPVVRVCRSRPRRRWAGSAWTGSDGDEVGMTTFGALGAPARICTSTSASPPRTSPTRGRAVVERAGTTQRRGDAMSVGAQCERAAGGADRGRARASGSTRSGAA